MCPLLLLSIDANPANAKIIITCRHFILSDLFVIQRFDTPLQGNNSLRFLEPDHACC